MIITFILLGNYLESVMKSKTQSSIKKSEESSVKDCKYYRDGEGFMFLSKKSKD